MTELSRRFFLGGAVSLLAVSASAMPKIMGNKPEIWGDGIHDDTSGIGALIRNEPVVFPSEKITIDGHGGVSFHNGIFRISQTIHVPQGARVEIHEPEFHGIDLEDDQPFFSVGPDHYRNFVAPLESGDEFPREFYKNGSGKVRFVAYREHDIRHNYSWPGSVWDDVVRTRGLLQLRAA